MASAASCFFWIVAAVAAIAVVAVGQFVFVLRRRMTTPPPPNDAWPKAAILLPLRDADPHLADGLRRLMRQDYRNYELHVILDSATDPAQAVVEKTVSETSATNVRTSVIRNKRSTCSPQCSALIQGVEDLAADVEVVAIIDGDVLTHPSWLRELVAPLREPGVGAAHGNRWFLPKEAGWGSIVRYVWIAASVPPMYWFGIPWAGTFAIRRRALVDSGLLAAWSQSIVPDAPAMSYLKKMGLTIRFVPSLMMINRERCNLRFAHDFVKRQLTWTRLYHPRFWPVVVQALLIAAGAFIGATSAIRGLFSGDLASVGWIAGAAATYLTASLVCLGLGESAVRDVARRRGQTDLGTPRKFWMRLPAAVVLTHAVHVSAVFLAALRNRVTWRGVTYIIRSPFDVTIEKDQLPIAEPRLAELDVSR